MPERRIAIVGGGMAGLTAAFELTRTESLRDRFEVTVYQLGWRLGGKCASGVDATGRNIEHGLHIWFGYYENTFALLEAVYAQWQPPAGQRITRREDAVRPQRLTPIGDGQEGKPGWLRVSFPTNALHPGKGEARIDTWQSLVHVLELVAQFTQGMVGSDDELAELQLSCAIAPAVPRVPGAEALHAHLSRRQLRVRDTPAWLQLVADSARAVNGHAPHASSSDLHDVVRHLRVVADVTRTQDIQGTACGNLLAQHLDVVAAFAQGVVADVLLGERSPVDLDAQDFRDWLVGHGAQPDSVRQSPFVTALYDTMFQYPDGDRARPLYGAGTAAQVVLRMLGTYAGDLAWKPAAGTGQAVVAPLYEVLKARGVRFAFFHKLVDVVVDDQEDAVRALHFHRQVDLVDPAGDYVPVRMCNGLLSWGSEPDWAAIEGGPALAQQRVDLESHWCTHHVGTVTLQRGEGFDDVILALPLGAFKRLNADDGPCAQLIERSAAFRRMADRQHLVPSVSVQVWSTATRAALGWPDGGAAAVGGPGPLAIWAEMSELLQHEGTLPGPRAASLHYLCDVFPSALYRRRLHEAATPQLADQQARQLARDWFDTHASVLWKNVGTPGDFAWDTLVSQGNARGEKRLDEQVVRANVDPAGCCVSSAPGTTAARLKCDRSGFAHLFLAGSWIDTGFNTECIEAAVMSGMQAARALTGEARVIAGERFLHPEDQPVSFCELVRGTIAQVTGAGGA